MQFIFYFFLVFKKIDERHARDDLRSSLAPHLVSLEELLVRRTLKGLAHQAPEPGAVLPELPQQLQDEWQHNRDGVSASQP